MCCCRHWPFHTNGTLHRANTLLHSVRAACVPLARTNLGHHNVKVLDAWSCAAKNPLYSESVVDLTASSCKDSNCLKSSKRGSSPTSPFHTSHFLSSRNRGSVLLFLLASTLVVGITPAVGLSAPNVTYSGPHEFTIHFEDDAAFASYNLVLYDSFGFDVNSTSTRIGRYFVLSGLTSSPVVVNSGNIGNFTTTSDNKATTSSQAYTATVRRVSSDNSTTDSPSVDVQPYSEAAAPSEVGICSTFGYDQESGSCHISLGHQQPNAGM